MSDSVDIRRMVLIALMGALILVLTSIQIIRVPGTNEYIHLGDIGITFAAYAFGPWVAMFAGGIGTALADIAGGYPQWALFSLVIHGLQGFLMGLIVKKAKDPLSVILSIIVGAAIIVGGYFVAGTILDGVGIAVLGLFPNTFQGLLGGVIGMPLYLAVLKAYPPLGQYSRKAS